MASRKLARDLFFSKHLLLRQQLVAPRQVSSRRSRLQLVPPNGHLVRREFSVFNEFSKKIKGEFESNPELQESIKEIKEKAKEIKEKAEGLKGVKEDLKTRTKQTTEQLYKHVDGVWTEAEAKAKQNLAITTVLGDGLVLILFACFTDYVFGSHLILEVYADVEEKISAAKEEVKDGFGIGKQESAGSNEKSSTTDKDGSKSFGEEKQHGQNQQSESSDNADTLFGKVKFGFSSVSPKVSLAFNKLKEAKPIDMVKKGYDILKDELKGNPNRRKRLEYDASSAAPTPNIERSTRTEIVVLPSKQSPWSKKWEALKNKMRGHPVFKHVSGYSEPVLEKSQEIAEDMRERWETSDHPVVHKIQDISETVLGESDTAMSFKEIRRRDPTFSLPEFVAEVQEVVKPVLNAYFKGNSEVLERYCSSHVIERCKAEHKAYESQGIFFDNKFQTQQVYCIRDRLGAITEGGQDTIHTVYYAWAMQQLEPDELGEGAPYSIWKLREMQQLGVKALI
ncbi:hypothetical protein RD792_016479 [Penstemon davidsonii]|uniref:Tim44-like domain-containing protein n=1 Tax=Penstemon davidsonii TaxID=160366 RepID=A0ABR0CKP5_9LAMI|nr:hypothetical protein RD792_016479 [Penstemon davidsonii]